MASNTANKDALVDTIAEKTNFTKKDVSMVLDILFDLIVDMVRKGDAVNITGFGKFVRKTRAAREGINPKTGERMTIQGMNTPKFTAGKAFKEAVR